VNHSVTLVIGGVLGAVQIMWPHRTAAAVEAGREYVRRYGVSEARATVATTPQKPDESVDEGKGPPFACMCAEALRF
jgi:hypothetical protein